MNNTLFTMMMYIFLVGLSLSYVSLAAYPCPSTCQCYGVIEIVIDCNDKKLTEVPYISVPTPPAGVSQVWVNLDLGGNDITALEPSSFGNLTFLRHLNLSANPITTVSHSWAGLTGEHILSLDVSYTYIADGSIQDLMSNLTALEILNIQENKLETLEFLASEAFSSVLRLDMSKNLFQSILANQMRMLSHLTVLIMSHNRLESVDPMAFQPLATNLRHLDLSNNSLDRSVMSALNHLTTLEILYIGSNNITLAPADVSSWELNNIQQLNMSSNPVTHFPADLLSKFTSLDVLNLDNCSLSEFAVNSTLPLRRLTMSNNSLAVLPEGLHLLTHLTTVNFAHNLLETIPNELKDPNALPVITDIDLSGNKFSYPSKKFIWTHWNLVRVTMRDGSLTVVASRTFYNSSQLRFLDLSFNKIAFIGVEAFLGLTYGSTIDLSNNLLVTMYWDIFPVDALALSLNFENNPFECDCRGNWMIEFAIKNDIRPAYCTDKATLTILSRSNWGCPLAYITSGSISDEVTRCPDGCTCLSYANFHQLNCHGINLQQIPENGFQNLSKVFWVDYSNSSVTQIHGNWTAENADSIIHLNLSSNQLTAATANSAIWYLNALNALDLSYNQIATLEEIDFSRIRMLEYLNLAGNQISSLSANSFSGLEYLNTLLLTNNKIRVIDAAAFIPFSSTLQKLDLSINQLISSVWIPLNELTDLTDLNVHTNNITEFTTDQQQLQKLTALDISSNPFHLVPDDLLNYLRSATKLDVSDTGLERITVPEYLPLQVLEVRQNKLTELPAGIEFLADLKQLDLSGNNISTIPNVLKNSSILSGLEDLALAGNQFLYPPKRFMQTHPNFIDINMSFGLMSYVGPETFLYSSKARHIDLSHNGLISINQRAFLGVTSGVLIDLSYNRLTALYIDILPQAITGITLVFDHNPFVCNCDSEWLQALIQENVLITPECANEHPTNTSVTSWNIFSGLALCITTTSTIPRTDNTSQTNTTTAVIPINKPNVTTTASTINITNTKATTTIMPATNLTFTNTLTTIWPNASTGKLNITATTSTKATHINSTIILRPNATTHIPTTNQIYQNTTTIVPNTSINSTSRANTTNGATRASTTTTSEIATVANTTETTASSSGGSTSSETDDAVVKDGSNGCASMKTGYNSFFGCLMTTVFLLRTSLD